MLWVSPEGPRWGPTHAISAGTRAQAPPATLVERHGRRGSQATWSRTLPFPAAVPAGFGPLRGKPACDLLWRLADGDGLIGVQLGLMGVQLGGKVIWAGLRGCGCGSGTAAPLGHIGAVL